MYDSGGYVFDYSLLGREIWLVSRLLLIQVGLSISIYPEFVRGIHCLLVFVWPNRTEPEAGILSSGKCTIDAIFQSPRGNHSILNYDNFHNHHLLCTVLTLGGFVFCSILFGAALKGLILRMRISQSPGS